MKNNNLHKKTNVHERILVVHPKHNGFGGDDVEDLACIYEGLDNAEVVRGKIPKRELLEKVEKASRVICLGHGIPQGLLSIYMPEPPELWIDSDFAQHFRNQPNNIYIFCNSDLYAAAHKLSGIAIGVFISNPVEGSWFGVNASKQAYKTSNKVFAAAVRQTIDAGLPNDRAAQYILARYSAAVSENWPEISLFNQDKIHAFTDGEASTAGARIKDLNSLSNDGLFPIV